MVEFDFTRWMCEQISAVVWGEGRKMARKRDKGRWHDEKTWWTRIWRAEQSVDALEGSIWLADIWNSSKIFDVSMRFALCSADFRPVLSNVKCFSFFESRIQAFSISESDRREQWSCENTITCIAPASSSKFSLSAAVIFSDSFSKIGRKDRQTNKR